MFNYVNNVKKDMVNSPEHYTGELNGQKIELKDVFEAFGLAESYNITSIIKYIIRKDRKDNELQDLYKAQRCLTDLIEIRERKLGVKAKENQQVQGVKGVGKY